MTPFFRRVIGAAMLDPAVYEEVEADRSATAQALVIVVCSSVAAAIGARGMYGAGATLTFFATASVIALLAWATWALLTFEIGARLMPAPDTRADPGELLRTLGFAAAPGLIQVFGVLPQAQRPAFTIAVLWTLVASIVAVRQALDYKSTTRALAVCGLGLVLSLFIAAVIGVLFGPTLAGLVQ